MADMFDPSIAEQLSRATKQIAFDTARTADNLKSSANTMAVLNTRMQALVGHTTGAANAAKNLTKNLDTAAKTSKSISTDANNTTDAFNKTQQSIQKSNGLLGFMKNTLRGVVTYILGDMIVALSKLHSAGFAPTQVAINGMEIGLTQIDLLLQGLPVTMSNIAGSVIGLTKNLGGSHMFTRQMVEDVTTLNALYGVSQQTGSKIESMLFRWSDGSQQTVDNVLNFAKGLADAKGVPVGDLLEDMAKNSALVARYGAQGAQAFLRQAVELRRMGVTVQEMSQFSDKLVGNFEDSLTATAKIQTFLPGFNMAAIQFAAQFGKEGDVAKELQNSLRGAGLKDLSQLPRSLRNALSGSLGMNPEALQNLLHPTKPTKPEPVVFPADFKGDPEKVVHVLLWGFKLLAGLLGVRLGGNILRSVLEGTGVPGGFVNRLLGRRGAGLIGGGASRAGAAEAEVATAARATSIGGRAISSIRGMTETVARVGSRAGGVLALGGLAATAVGNKLSKLGHGTAGAVTSTLGMAATGGGIGMLFGPVGAAIGAALGGLVGLFSNAAVLLKPIFKWTVGVIINLTRLIGKVVIPVIDFFANKIAAAIDIIGKMVPNWAKRLWGAVKSWGDVAETSNRAAQANDSLAKSVSMVQDKFADVGGQNFGFAKQLYENQGGTVGMSSAGLSSVPAAATVSQLAPPVGVAEPTTTGNTDISVLIQSVRELAVAYKSTKWDVLLDGKKVGMGIMAANRA